MSFWHSSLPKLAIEAAVKCGPVLEKALVLVCPRGGVGGDWELLLYPKLCGRTCHHVHLALPDASNSLYGQTRPSKAYAY